MKGNLESSIDYQLVYWNLQTANRGLSGATSRDLKERLDNLVIALSPDLVFLGLGDNDYFMGIDEETSFNNTFEIIEKLLSKNIKIVFTTVIPSGNKELNKKISGYIETDRKVAKIFEDNKNFIFVDLFKLFSEDLLEKSYTLISPTGNKDVGYGAGELDYIHYNKFGNANVASILLKEVFDVDFDVNNFLKDLNDNTKKYPDY